MIPYAVYLAISGVPPDKVFHYFMINTSICLVGCNLGMFLMRHVCGRRTLLFIGSVANAAFMLALAVSASVETSPDTSQALVIAFVSLFLIVYTFTTGAVTRPVATELVSTRLRAYSFGLTQAVSQLVIWLVSFCTPYFINPQKMHWVSLSCIHTSLLLTFPHRTENMVTSLSDQTSFVLYGITSSFPRQKAARLKRLTSSLRRKWQPKISRHL